ncbi:TetR family transcriptional regulator [Streptomyces rubellomurinus subsp. indigoferus]|uniref:TetR family transcriptional regulator n=1 Tax=Streptomyces rubellomurinus (strain ATCC 31215) TaxID=359131 RepID=A0A0F2T4U8_STRR3|nr:TetR/AcrR family transcriptional regulator [Streptomyces rubellomurinus]KJS57243.1 TetR family transcriptional regulator [Streptomyces rubellomurinus subsp. indigoferus]KJS58218.1 TetR family transcriptional regulator [Streptomyces rubellomurinus]
MAYRRTPAVQARLDAQREVVLQAAVGLLAERGYGGCTVAAVADRAGIATGSLYQHFANKAELSVELFRRVVNREIAEVGTALARQDTPQQRIAAVVETFATRALRAPRLAYALLVEPADAVVDGERLVFRRAFRDMLATEIAAALANGELPEQDPVLTAAALVGAVGEALAGPLAGAPESGAADPARAAAEVVPALVSFTLRALGGRDDSDA